MLIEKLYFLHFAIRIILNTYTFKQILTMHVNKCMQITVHVNYKCKQLKFVYKSYFIMGRDEVTLKSF